MILLISLACCTAWAIVCSGRSSGRRSATKRPFGAGGNSAGQRSKKGGRRGPAHCLERSIEVLSAGPSGADVGAVSADARAQSPAYPRSPLGDRGAEQ